MFTLPLLSTMSLCLNQRELDILASRALIASCYDSACVGTLAGDMSPREGLSLAHLSLHCFQGPNIGYGSVQFIYFSLSYVVWP